MSVETTDYAVCAQEGCKVALPTPEDAREHIDATMTPTGATTGVTATAHSYRILNPTPEEKAQRAVDRIVQTATERACEDLDSEIQSGRVQPDDVRTALSRYPDFSDEWDAWTEGDR
jgi:hypothetical protein